MIRLSSSFLFLAWAIATVNAQDIDQLKARKEEKLKRIAALQGEVATLDSEISKLLGPAGWEFGSTGTIGLNFSQFNNWVSTDSPNTFSSTIGFSGSAFANLDREFFFWRNTGLLNIAKTKFDTDTEDNSDADYETSADAFGISSLYGHKLSPTLAISALGEYRTTFLSNFNDPGLLDLGTGGTWTPMKNFVVVVHPLNYNIVFSKSSSTFDSSLGAKLVADYSRQLPKAIAWRSNLSSFFSYKDLENLSNWIWTNSFSAFVWKGLGLGFELGLKMNKQEAYNYKLKTDGLTPDVLPIDNLSSDDNPLQTYWLLGITYKL